MSSNSNTNNQDATATKRKRSDGSVKKSSEEKRKERLIANRRAAYNCRMRKRILIEELQRQVVELTRKNIAAEEENARLRVAMDMKPLEHGDGQQEVLLESSTVGASEFASHSRNSPAESDFAPIVSMNNSLATANTPGGPSIQDLIIQRQMQASDSLRAALLQYRQNAILEGALSLPHAQLVERRESLGGYLADQQSQPRTAFDLISHNQVPQSALADFQPYSFGAM